MTITMSLQQEIVIQQMTLKMEVVLMLLLLDTHQHEVGMSKYTLQPMDFQKLADFISKDYFLQEAQHYQILLQVQGQQIFLILM